MSIFATVYWGIWLAMLVVGDPLWLWLGGEKDTDTHLLATYIPLGIRAGILGWLVYHFLVQHVRS